MNGGIWDNLSRACAQALRDAGLQATETVIHPSCVVIDASSESLFKASSLTRDHASAEILLLRATAVDDATVIVQGRIRLRIANRSPKPATRETPKDASLSVFMHLKKADGENGEAWEALSIYLARPPKRNDQRITLDDGARVLHLDPARILYIESSGKSQIIHLEDGSTRRARLPLYKIESRLPGFFMRVHRCFIVNKLHISEVSRQNVKLDDGSLLPVAERRYPAIRQTDA